MRPGRNRVPNQDGLVIAGVESGLRETDAVVTNLVVVSPGLKDFNVGEKLHFDDKILCGGYHHSIKLTAENLFHLPLVGNEPRATAGLSGKIVHEIQIKPRPRSDGCHVDPEGSVLLRYLIHLRLSHRVRRVVEPERNDIALSAGPFHCAFKSTRFASELQTDDELSWPPPWSVIAEVTYNRLIRVFRCNGRSEGLPAPCILTVGP